MGATNGLGLHGRAVQANVQRLRAARRFTYVQLAERLQQIGRPIPVLGLRRIERGERRVDVDDFVALATALNVYPTDLLRARSMCTTCAGSPPPGFICAACRAGEPDRLN